jgi:ABC-2 type transport system ATP-binding protein
MAGAEATASGTGAVALRTRNLTKRYGSLKAVDNLNLTVRQGQVFGLLGPNGAGKTTTILMLLGLTEPTSGSARVLDLDPARNPLAVKRQVGYMPDEVGFYGGLTGRQNLRYTARLNAIDEAAGETRIDALLARVGLADAGDRKVETYSRGMRQRLGLADVLVKGPSIIILDEPTAAIDPAGVVEVLALVRELADEGAAILLASHLLHQVQQICDEVAIFVAGKMVAAGPMSTLARQLGGGQATIELIADGPFEDVRRAINGVAGVTRVERDPRDERVVLVTAERDVRARLAEVLVGARHPPLMLRRHGDELDYIYRRYFADHEGTTADAA